MLHQANSNSTTAKPPINFVLIVVPMLLIVTIRMRDFDVATGLPEHLRDYQGPRLRPNLLALRRHLMQKARKTLLQSLWPTSKQSGPQSQQLQPRQPSHSPTESEVPVLKHRPDRTAQIELVGYPVSPCVHSRIYGRGSSLCISTP